MQPCLQRIQTSIESSLVNQLEPVSHSTQFFNVYVRLHKMPGRIGQNEEKFWSYLKSENKLIVVNGAPIICIF